MTQTPRIAPITEATANAEQRRVGDLIYKKREPYQGPSAILLHVPELAERLDRLRAHVLAAGVRKDVLQLATLITARHWSADYVWGVRERLARDAGIDPAIIEAVRHRQRPDFGDSDQEAICDCVSELRGPIGPSEGAHARAVAVVGETGLLEVVAAVSVYTMLALTTRAADLPAHPGATPLAR